MNITRRESPGRWPKSGDLGTVLLQYTIMKIEYGAAMGAVFLDRTRFV
jgi:hypothetical protein